MQRNSSSDAAASQLRLFASQAAEMPPRVRRMLAGWVLTVTANLLLEAWEPLVLEALAERMRPRTAAKAVVEAARLFRSLRAQGAEQWGEVTTEMAVRWYWAARPDSSGRWRNVEVSTARNRRWVALAVFEEAARLGAPIDPPTLAGTPIPRPSEFTSTRPLKPSELQLVQVHAHTGLFASRRLPITALSFAGGTATEIALVRPGDIDLNQRTVTFGGSAARTNPLDGWSAEVLERWFANQIDPPDPASPLCVGAHLSVDRAAHSVSVRLGEVLRDAGLKGTPGVTARSLRLTTAKQILDTDGLAAAAHFLGSPSLDNTAKALDFDWRRDG